MGVLFRAACVAAFALFCAGPAFAKASDCLLEVDGQRYIDGPCQFVAHPGGSFELFTLRGAGVEYAAEVERVEPGKAMGFWNARTGDARPVVPLGVLSSSAACWTNARVRICAWKWGEPRYFAEAPPAQTPLAAADPSKTPTRVGMCVDTAIAGLGSRLEGAPDSGSSVSYANTIYGVSYEIVAAIRNSRIGDPIKLCLVSLPEDFPY
jgi:hypothetical protein